MVYRILLMDDEKAICEITGILLKKLGYEPVTVANVDEVLNEYKSAIDNDKRFDVVILDLSVNTGMGGKETLEHLVKLDPKVQALVSSGNLTDPAVISYADYGFAGILSKAYNKKDLDKAIKDIIQKKI
jgi:DNA-binding NtrC family response regulator